jgi:hypothetical protein
MKLNRTVSAADVLNKKNPARAITARKYLCFMVGDKAVEEK